MADQEGKYNIKAAALMLGIQPGTLRAWERRYQMIAPVRNEAGHRLYTEEHIKTLKWLINKVNQGFTISQAIGLLGHSESSMFSEVKNWKQTFRHSSYSDQLFNALIHFKEIQANELFDSIFSIFSIEKVMFDVLRPLLLKLEDSLESGEIFLAQEQYARSYITTKINHLNHSFLYYSHLPKVLTVSCSRGDEDSNLLIFSFLLRRRGMSVINAGANITKKEIEKVMKFYHPDLLIISCSNDEKLHEAMKLVTHFAANHKDLTIGLEGAAFQSLKNSETVALTAAFIGQTPTEWEKWLMERMG